MKSNPAIKDLIKKARGAKSEDNDFVPSPTKKKNINVWATEAELHHWKVRAAKTKKSMASVARRAWAEEYGEPPIK